MGSLQAELAYRRRCRLGGVLCHHKNEASTALQTPLLHPGMHSLRPLVWQTILKLQCHKAVVCKLMPATVSKLMLHGVPCDSTIIATGLPHLIRQILPAARGRDQ